MDQPKITSLRRQEASRRNGAQSKGPVTPEGRNASSRNAVKHGCLATLLTFNPDEADLFNHIHAEYTARFEPRDQAENDLVEEIVRAKWQMRQAWAYESSILGLQLVQDAGAVARTWKSIGEQDRRALALSASLAGNNTIPNLQRYSRNLAMQAERAFKMLMELKKQRLPPAGDPGETPTESTERNEPSPIFGHPGPTACTATVATVPAAFAVYPYAVTAAAPRVLSNIPISPIAFPAPPKVSAAGA